MLVTLGYDMTFSHDTENKGEGWKDTTENDLAHRVVLGAQFLF